MSNKLTGGDVNYYLAEIKQPKRPEFAPYVAECEDIIEALGMTFAEGSAFKAIWRSCAARTLGVRKAGMDQHGVYDAEKVKYYGGRMLEQRKKLAPTPKHTEPSITQKYSHHAPYYNPEVQVNRPLPATHLKTIIEALEAFSNRCSVTNVGDQVPDNAEPSRYVEVFENGRKIRLVMETVCSIAATELSRLDSDGAKFRRLVEGLRTKRLDHLYEQLMKESMP